MGIKSLSKFLKDNFSNIFQIIHISEYQYKKIAIDTSLYLCHYKALYQERWLSAFIKLVCLLRENDVHCVFIYDTSFPVEKQQERKERMESRSRTEEKIFKLEEAIEKYNTSSEIEPILIDFQNKRKIKTPMLSSENSININAIEYHVNKMKKQMFSISPEDFLTTKKLFDILNIPYFNADMEAETLCADLCIQGKVDAVLSEDTDVLAYGSPVFLTKINTTDSTCIRIRQPHLLETLGLNQDEFLDFCIMCGTDYNKNIYKIGPSKAFKFITEYKNIENINEKAGIDVTILNHIRVRELFKNYKKSTYKVSYCGQPDFKQLETFLFNKNINTPVSSIKRAFTEKLIVIEDDES